ncbi:hypothetical protein G9A89_022534 [Geosiphon pyriformis]|nr:hypothetical protein G9A89_022534 [Geosiphon pyriformis]
MSVYMMVIDLVSRVAPRNNETDVVFLSLNGKIAASDLSLVTVAGGFGYTQFLNSTVMILTAGWMNWKLVGEQLLPISSFGIELDTLVIDKLGAASLVGNLIDIFLSWVDISKFGTGDQSCNIDFPIINFLFLTYSQSLNALVYHSSGKYASLAATADWIMMRDMTNFVCNL